METAKKKRGGTDLDVLLVPGHGIEPSIVGAVLGQEELLDARDAVADVDDAAQAALQQLVDVIQRRIEADLLVQRRQFQPQQGLQSEEFVRVVAVEAIVALRPGPPLFESLSSGRIAKRMDLPDRRRSAWSTRRSSRAAGAGSAATAAATGSGRSAGSAAATRRSEANAKARIKPNRTRPKQRKNREAAVYFERHHGQPSGFEAHQRDVALGDPLVDERLFQAAAAALDKVQQPVRIRRRRPVPALVEQQAQRIPTRFQVGGKNVFDSYPVPVATASWYWGSRPHGHV